MVFSVTSERCLVSSATMSNSSQPLTGLSKTFNAVTIKGRANVTKATLGSIAALYIFYK